MPTDLHTDTADLARTRRQDRPEVAGPAPRRTAPGLLAFLWRERALAQVGLALLAVAMFLAGLAPIELQRRAVGLAVRGSDPHPLLGLALLYVLAAASLGRLLCRTLGIAEPKAAILSAVETVATKLGSTLDAAALCKMAERGQITGGRVDGPLAFDTAVSREAARAKGLGETVAGDSDILVAPDLVSGNMLAKQLIHLAGAEAAGPIIGARVPIVLTSRADGAETRAASCALAQLFVHGGGAASPGAAPCPDARPTGAAA
ncbi:phosphate acyltransferase [Methylobacterium nonmethylotrophicum]|uniref:phosphate acyltransferase n=1 Tax=Methylobacterium nonmethylotrophicum TaxID=1141884 RepID=UPI001FE11586|nr:phosphate acyltransferase [Methylobacterium nonmethylotrophicum]